MKRYVLVYNPISGNAAFRGQLDGMIEAFQRRDAMLIPYRTRLFDTRMGDFFREARPDGVLSAGGDGTLNEVVNVILRESLPLPVGIIGSGTSNDFATYLGVKRDAEAYFDRIVSGVTRPADVGRANGRYFINVASAGALASVAHEADVRLKHAIGKTAYYLRGLGKLLKLRPFRLSVTADGASYEEDAYLFVIVNSSVAAGMKRVAARAEIDDGKLDMIVVRACGMPDFMALAKRVVSGTVSPEDKHLLYVQAERFTVRAGSPVESDLDGERGPALPLTVETVKRAIRVYAMQDGTAKEGEHGGGESSRL